MKIKTLIIDDEPISIKGMEALIENHCEDLELLGSAADEEDGLEKIYTLKPDLIFLDIELGGQTGFDLLKKCSIKNFEVIFVTAHDQFGIDAVKAHALDYILKPINKAEFLMAVSNAVQVIQKKKGVGNSGTTKAHRISLSTLDGIMLVDSADIIFAESEGRYTRFHLNNNTKQLVSKNLGEFESILEAKGFARIHHSYLVNLAYVQKYIKGRGGYVILKNGQSLIVSSRKKDEFIDRLEE
jgi:two-component system, LytTR family, response regulator